MRFRLALLLLWSCTVCAGALAQPNPNRVADVMQPGEELVYEVSWSFFTLGKIRVVTLPEPTDGASFSTAAYSDSYDLPFVDFHAISTSEMDSTLFTMGSTLAEKREQNWFRQVYLFDPETKIYVTENSYVKNPKITVPLKRPTYDTLRIPHSRFQDGTSILYFARARVHNKVAIRVPTLVRGKSGYTNFYFPGEQTSISIDAVPYPIQVVELLGKADFEGIFGLTGDFRGWFSDDKAAVPIKAEMKVILGSVTIELLEWKRKGWTPPRGE